MCDRSEGWMDSHAKSNLSPSKMFQCILFASTFNSGEKAKNQIHLSNLRLFNSNFKSNYLLATLMQ